MDPVRAIADAVLYEGYLLWPYRRSATKNQRRWTFGGVYPRAHSERHPDDRCTMLTECLLEGDEARVTVSVRFLQVVRRQVLRAGEPVDELIAGGVRHLSWDEAVERELALEAPGSMPIAIAAGCQEEPLDGGAIMRSWEALAGTVQARAEPVADGIRRVSVEISNTTPWEGAEREDALRRTFCSTHAVLRASAGRFISQTDPPQHLRAAARDCRNEGAWPVLVDEQDRTVLSSAIILEDHPRIAPESPGDLFDGGEIDQMLVLNILSLTDAEKAEMRDSDPRAREILERTEALSEDELMRLHGAIREFGMAR
ncbi:MAG TPA: hypothetical protein VEY49_10340 [Solirubrobacteraceae bacterium]|nr:hypothetical protein [Solirubrobacteraceae bacterium]